MARKRKKSEKTSKKKQKKRGPKKPDPPAESEKPAETPGIEALPEQPRPGPLPKTPPRAPKKPSRIGRPPRPKVKKPPTEQPPPEVPPPEIPEGPPEPPAPTPEMVKARSGARLLGALEISVADQLWTPETRADQKEMLEEGWYEYLLSIGGEIPPWLGLLIAHAYAFGPRYMAARKAKKAKK